MSKGKKLKKLAVALAAIVTAPLVFACCVVLYTSARYSGTGLYEANWGVTLPGGVTELYRADGTGGLQGDGTRYTVYACEDIWGLSVELTTGADEAFRAGFYEVTDELDVPGEHLPDFDAGCECAVVTDAGDERNNLYIVWDGERLYLAEWIM